MQCLYEYFYTGTRIEATMLSKKERRFVRAWEEQRSGSKVGYYTLYVLIWFFVAMLGLFFIFVNVTDVYRNKLSTLYQMMAMGMLIAITAISGWSDSTDQGPPAHPRLLERLEILRARAWSSARAMRIAMQNLRWKLDQESRSPAACRID